MPEFNLDFSFVMWQENDMVSSTQIPRNLTDFSSQYFPTRIILLFPKYKLFTWTWLLGSLYKIYLVFLEFIVKLFAENHISALYNSSFALLIKL